MINAIFEKIIQFGYYKMKVKSIFGIKIAITPLVFFLLSLFIIITLPACKTEQEKQAAKIEKTEKMKKKQGEKQYEKDQKRHMKIQDKETRKRMKKSKSKMMDQTYVKKRSCWSRFFGKRDKTCPKK